MALIFVLSALSQVACTIENPLFNAGTNEAFGGDSSGESSSDSDASASTSNDTS